MGAAGKTVEVLGGRTTRPSARKVRNNKVYTIRGPRDRRVRLSADIAIQFYDVQDRLGYDRASEAIDWLIKKAKVSIDKLFDDTTSQQYQHLFQLGENCLQGGYVQGFSSMADNSINISRFNCTDYSTLYPHMENSRLDLSYKMSHKNYGKEDACFNHDSAHSYQQMHVNGQNSGMIMSNSIREEHEFLPNSEPFFIKSLTRGQSYDLSLAHTTNDLNLAECLSAENGSSVRGCFSDEAACLSISVPSHQYQEPFEGFSQPFFHMPASSIQ